MSVIVADIEVFEYVAAGLHKMAFNNTINEWYNSPFYNYCIGPNIGPSTECLRMVKNWCRLNEQSYNIRYKEPLKAELFEFIEFRPSKYKLDPFQMLRYLEFIRYNIEDDQDFKTMFCDSKGIRDMEWLEAFITGLRIGIINQMPAYKLAKWADKP